MRRGGSAVLLAILLVLAGCSAVGTPAERDATPTLTPAPVPETSTSMPARPDTLRQPLEPWDVADGHAAALGGRNYTLVLSRNRTIHRPGPLRSHATTLVVRVSNRTTYRVDRTLRATNWTGHTTTGTETTEYAAGGTVFERRPPDGPVRAHPIDRPRGREGVVADRAEAVVARYLATEETTVSRAGDDREAAFVVHGRGAPPAVVAATDGSVAAYRVRATVGADGRVQELTARWRPSKRAIVTVRMRYRQVGDTTVVSPSWRGSTAPRGSDVSAADIPLLDDTGDESAGGGINHTGAAAAYRENGTDTSADGWVGWPAWAGDD